MLRILLSVLLLTCILPVTACAPRSQPFEPAQIAPSITREALHTGSTAILPLRSWSPEGEAPKAVIIALHGFNDYSNAFVNPGHYLAAKGIALYAYDQRGFGATKERGIWAGRENLVGDLKQMVLAVRAAHPGVPLYLLGESMGGAVVINALAEPDFPPVDGAILSAPAVWGSETMPILYRGALWTGAHTLPWVELTGKGLKILATDNIPLLREMGRDPLIIKRTRIDAVYGIVGLMDEAYDNAKEVKTPLLLLYGMNDQVIPRKPILEVADTLTAPYKLVYYPAGFHMLMRDLGSEVVMNDVVAWIANRDAFLPSGYDLNWRPLMNPMDSEEQ
ncbi:MAG: alpha/beta hydrolase [Alphaproteobacteria bacterium]|nr:alpha/beta hydrolase [Alphaproteobacteria bacterium]